MKTRKFKNCETRFCRLAVLIAVVVAAPAQAITGTVTQVTSVNNTLRFWLKECGDQYFYYVGMSDPSHEDIESIVMTAKFGSRPLTVDGDCPSGDHRKVAYVELVVH